MSTRIPKYLVVDTETAQRYAAVLSTSPEVTKAEIGIGLEQCSLLAVREIQEAAPLGVTGALKGSVTYRIEPEEKDVVAVIYSPLKYAAPVELGTRPHFPPLEPLKDWVAIAFGLNGEQEIEKAARAVQRKIGLKGTDPQNFFGGPLARLGPQFREILMQSVNRLMVKFAQLNG